MSDYNHTDIGSGYNTKTAINTELGLVETAIATKMDSAGDTLTGNIDMNSNQILNLANGIAGTDAVNVNQLNGINSGTNNTATLVSKVISTASQTVFTTPNYVMGTNNLSVYVNGQRQHIGDSYTETTSTSITFSTGLNLSDEAYLVVNEVGETLTTVLAGNVQYTPSGAGAVATNVQTKLQETVSVKDFGAVGDGVTDDTLAIKTAFDSLIDGDTLVFPSGTYLVSYSGTKQTYAYALGDLTGLSNITVIGYGATIKCVNHNVGTYGGLLFIYSTGATSHLTVKGITLDMTFTGVNTSASYYPFAGGIVLQDSDTGSQTQAQICHHLTVKDCNFKLYHPYGQYAQSGAAFGGDPNNGFKIFPLFVSGDYLATAYANQSRGVTISNCTLLEGHNGYGFWTWSWNDVVMTECTAESFVSKQSNSSGVYSGVGEPMMRYHQFHCSGLSVTNNYFRAKPCNERTVAGFEGQASFVHYNTNLDGAYSHGTCVISDNTIECGRGDLANTAEDWYIYLIAYGSITVSGNSFNGTSETTNAYGANTGIFWNNESTGHSGGRATLNISNNTFGVNCDYIDNINISNGGATDAGRVLKQVSIEGNTSLGQAQYFLKTGSTSTFFGVQDMTVNNNLINGEYNALWNTASSNSRAIEVSASESTDVGDVSKNTIRDKYYGIETNGFAGTLTTDYNTLSGVTTHWLGALPITSDRGTGAPSLAAANGSSYIRTDGTAGSAVYTRIAGAWVAHG